MQLSANTALSYDASREMRHLKLFRVVGFSGVEVDNAIHVSVFEGSDEVERPGQWMEIESGDRAT